MNTLTKTRILEKGDEWKTDKGEWRSIPESEFGIQIMYSKYEGKEVRRPSESPPPPALVEQGSQTVRQESAKLPIEGSTPSPAFHDPALDAMEAEAEELRVKASLALPTVVSLKAHKPMPPPVVTAHPAGNTVRIRFPAGSQHCQWIGRNGMFTNRAINLHRYDGDVIAVVPQGKRGAARNAIIEFPVSIIPQVIEWLEEQLEK